MEQQPKTRMAECSRRSVLRNVALAAAGAAAFSAAMSDKAEAKVAQKLVAYQDHPNGTQQCDNCAQFEAPSSCKVVDGTISPTGWCRVYARKPGG